MKNKKNRSFGDWPNPLLSVLVVVLFAASVLSSALALNRFFEFQNTSLAAFNSSTGRYEDVLTSPHQIAEYNYIYENQSGGSATGYFEIVLSNNIGDTPSNILDVVSIVDTYPVNSSGVPLSGATTREMPPASYYFIGGQLVVRFGPQASCSPRSQGGCNDSTIAPGQHGKISVKLALKTNGSITPSTIQGSGQVRFNSGTVPSLSTIGWQIQTLYQKSSNVLDNNQIPSVVFRGSGGTGQVFEGQPYTLVISDIKAVNGSNLTSPGGSCATLRNGQTFSGFGISGGVCTITVNQPAPSILPGGVLNLSDNGSPRPILASYNYSSQAAFASPNNYSSRINNVSFNGDRSLFVVDFETSGFVNGENGFHTNFYYNTESNSIVNKSTSSGSPYNTATINKPAAATEICVTVARPDNLPIPNSGNCYPLPTFQVDITKVPLGIGDMASLTFSCETGSQSAFTICSFSFPPNRSLPNDFFMAVGNAGPGGRCDEFESRAICRLVPVGSGRGLAQIYAFIGNQSVDTGELVRILGNNEEDTSDSEDDSSGPVEDVSGEGDSDNPSDNTESGVTTVTINRGSVTSDGEAGGEDPNPSQNLIIDDTEQNNQDSTSTEETEKNNENQISISNPEGLPNTGGVTFFIVSGLSSLAILSIFSVSIKRKDLKISNKK